MSRTKILIATVCLLTLTSTWWLHADPPAHRINDASGALMRSKLTHSQNVLAGVLRKDFRLIAQGAREMKRISEAAEWPRARDGVYEHFAEEFRRQCSELEQLAATRNHDGVTFTYLSMTTTCVRCHNHVRDSLRLAGPNEAGDVRFIPAQWPERTPRAKPSNE
ncbi:MAG: hypothetical protein HKN47_23545 [Pirellulaceae bacterium]|nr:hypothetical protein [Pirellulaceae bacterium]